MKQFVFIDESGGPHFFGRKKRPLWEGEEFVPILLIGLVITSQRSRLRKAIEAFKSNVLADPLYNEIHSINKGNWNPHARSDYPDLRAKFFELIRKMDYIECYVVIARKNPNRFTTKHNGNEKEFYFDVLNKLIQQLPMKAEDSYQLFLSRIQKNTVKDFVSAVEKAFEFAKGQNGEGLLSYNCDVVLGSEYPEMCVIDYLLWALQRYILKGERRFYSALENVFKVVYDVYDTEAENNVYGVNNPFDLSKASDFGSLEV